ncbi:MAG: hypothetical protein HYX40_04995 [Sphingobacteriales bacterium]|nr:hypothetical protein [Sphingobacteriales bacterium]
MKKIIFTILLLLPFILSLAQESKDKPKAKSCGCRFQSINQTGLLQGQYESAVLLQTVNGIRMKQWFTGIGAGIDYYRFRSIPVFADVRRYLLNKKSSPFIYADGGVNFSWVENSKKILSNRGVTAGFSNGLYTDVGLGYSFGVKNNVAFLLSAGYSYRNITEKREITVWCFMPPCPPYIETYKYGLNRLAVKLGVQF